MDHARICGAIKVQRVGAGCDDWQFRAKKQGKLDVSISSAGVGGWVGGCLHIFLSWQVEGVSGMHSLCCRLVCVLIPFFPRLAFHSNGLFD